MNSYIIIVCFMIWQYTINYIIIIVYATIKHFHSKVAMYVATHYHCSYILYVEALSDVATRLLFIYLSHSYI